MSLDYLKKGEFAVISHRGGSLESPENTMEAFEKSFENFSEIIFELDVHCTRDGEIVVIHDDRVDRTTNGHGAVSDFTYGELEKLDAGHIFSKDGGKTFPFRNKGVKISRLQDVLESFPNTRISIEAKQSIFSQEQKLVAVIDKAPSRQRLCLAGENHTILTKLRCLAPDLCSGFSAREILVTYFAAKYYVPFGVSSRGKVMQIPYTHKGNLVANPRLIHKAHCYNKFVHVWTVNDEPTMKKLIFEGADGIITDAPTLLLKVAREAKKI